MTKTHPHLALVFCVFAAGLCLSSYAQGTAFTYQGRLNDTGQLANGSYDFRFKLYSQPQGGSQASPSFATNGIPVINGLFTTAVDFGPGLFVGSNYWLEVNVKTNAASTYATLNPRQLLSPTPYAIMANSASNLLGTLPAGQVNGTLADGNLPASPTFAGTVTAGAFSGDASALTSLSPENLSSGPVSAYLFLTNDSNRIAGYAPNLSGVNAESLGGRLGFLMGGYDVVTSVGLEVNTYISMFDHPLYLRGLAGVNRDGNHGLAYCGPGVTNFAPTVLPDGPVLWGFSGGALGVVAGGAHSVLTWMNGSVFVNGGFSFSSDRNLKTGFTTLCSREILDRVATLPVTSWVYQSDASARHIGPMAQDFHAAFHVNGDDDTHINVGDETGVALAAIQGLNEKLKDELKIREAENTELKQHLAELKAMVSQLDEKIDRAGNSKALRAKSAKAD